MWRFWIIVMLVCGLPKNVFSQPADQSAPSKSEVVSPAYEPYGPYGDYPGSIIDELREDAKRKDYLFQLPGANRVLRPWYAFKSYLDDKYWFRFGVSFAALYQKASDTVTGADEAAGLDIDIVGTWNFLGRGTDRPTLLGFRFTYRTTLGTEFPPGTLFTQIGSLWPTGTGFGENAFSVAELWLQQDFQSGKYSLRAGKVFPFTAYNFFPLRNFRVDFVDFNHVGNLTIPLPDFGLGAFAQYRPRRDVYLRLGVHDANASVEDAGFDTLFGDGELFTIFEVGFDPGFMEPQPGRPPFGDVHLSLWYQDERDDANVDNGWGVQVSASQQFGRFLPYLRYGYSGGGGGGPTVAKHMWNTGVAIDRVLGQSNDRIGIGFTWAKPVSTALDDQGTLELYYRVQVTPVLAISPMLQVIINPARNQDEDLIFIGGIRGRIAF